MLKKKTLGTKFSLFPLKLVVLPIILIIVGFGIYSIIAYRQSGVEEHGLVLEEKPGFKAVHWHAKLKMSACGKKLKLPLEKGTPLLHTHKDSEKIHIEGLITGPEDATLGKFMQAVSVSFSQNRLFDFVNDSMCSNGKSNILRMIVRGLENSEFENYPIADGDVIELIYE